MIGTEFIDRTPERAGTPLNRVNLMGIQGFTNSQITFNNDGSITEYNVDDNSTKTTVFNEDGSIVVTFTGEKTITKTITFSEEGNAIFEVLS